MNNRLKKINFREFDEGANLYNKVNALYDIVRELIDIIDRDGKSIDLDRFSQYGLDQIDSRVRELIKENQAEVASNEASENTLQ